MASSSDRKSSPEASSEIDAPAAAPATDSLRAGSPDEYTVVARRYRPQRFEDVVGQDHVVQALRNAIRMNRIAQAYLFSGTRGVGKTSMARIFAKCLNCITGPTETPCLKCDVCQAIARGQDVDVIEIDGASNNGVEQVRELRQNVALRPSRSRFKIYYIDEVHMLSTGAFNALLKTLEEPPAHVKFFFATTEPNKIPITVLSRCQKYDFAGITPESIAASLGEICAREQVEAEPEALQAVARRASGSMRDAQSLLEQLLASGRSPLTVEIVHGLLGTADDERLLDLLDALADHDAAAALGLLDRAANDGVQPSELLGGLLEFLRDAMVLAAGADALLLAVGPRRRPRLQKLVGRWPLDSIMTALQILAEARSRMRGSPHSRLLVELALVKVARLADFVELGAILRRLEALGDDGAGAKKKQDPDELTTSPASTVRSTPGQGSGAASTPTSGATIRAEPLAAVEAEPPPPAAAGSLAPDFDPLDLAQVRQAWPDLLKKVGPAISWRLSQTEPGGVEGSNVLVIVPKPGYNGLEDLFQVAGSQEKIEQILRRLLGKPTSIRYEPGRNRADGADAGVESSASTTNPPPVSAAAGDGRTRRTDALTADPLVKKVVELFEARPYQLDLEAETDDSA